MYVYICMCGLGISSCTHVSVRDIVHVHMYVWVIGYRHVHMYVWVMYVWISSCTYVCVSVHMVIVMYICMCGLGISSCTYVCVG